MDEEVYIGDRATEDSSTSAAVTILIDGEEITLEVARDKNILETFIEEGHHPPYSCLEAACTACLGKITKGVVWQQEVGILDEDHIAANEALTCQSFPRSAQIYIDYDNTF